MPTCRQPPDELRQWSPRELSTSPRSVSSFGERGGSPHRSLGPSRGLEGGEGLAALSARLDSERTSFLSFLYSANERLLASEVPGETSLPPMAAEASTLPARKLAARRKKRSSKASKAREEAGCALRCRLPPSPARSRYLQRRVADRRPVSGAKNT